MNVPTPGKTFYAVITYDTTDTSKWDIHDTYQSLGSAHDHMLEMQIENTLPSNCKVKVVEMVVEREMFN